MFSEAQLPVNLELDAIAETDTMSFALISQQQAGVQEQAEHDSQHLESEAMQSGEQSLLQRVARGEEGAVEACIEAFGGLVWSLANRYCRSRADAEDATQDIFLKLWQVADRYKPEAGSEATFIATIARRRLIDLLRRDAKLSSVQVDSDIVAESAPGIQIADGPEIADEHGKALRCMEKLTERQQHVLKLSIQDGWTHPKIAESLEIPLGTVKTFARRGLLALRDCMRRPLDAASVRS